MGTSKTIRNIRYKCYSLLMLLALAWLTVSLPFVYDSQQAQKAAMEKQSTKAGSDDSSNPLTNTTEEKTENGVNTLAEYLHESHHSDHPSSLIITSYKYHSSDLYIAFHPELICPPPDVRVS